MNKIKKLFKKYFPVSLRDSLIFIVTILITSAFCLVLKDVSDSDFHVPMIFVLAVLVISLLTDGYFYGCFAALLSVFAVNWAFTFPYFKMDFSIYGYPLTFMTMLTVGIATSMLTSRVRAQEKVRLESEKEKMRANLLRAVSHDLRTPLTAISGSISAVLEDGESLGDSECRELLIDAKKDAEWLCRMVENLLSITKISGEEVKRITKQPEILEEVFSEAVVNFKKRYPHIVVSVTVPEALVFVPMDAMLIEQVLFNLMDNSVRHGGCTSHIKINAVLGSKHVNIMVSDNGNGIDGKVLPHLFNESIKLDNTSDKTRGMGIGLLVCRTIIQAHGGNITAHNLSSGGACFSFTLELGGENNYD